MINYDLKYYYKVLRLNSSTAELINSIRWNWVKECNAETILDFGCGPGWFEAFSPNGSVIDTYDIMPVMQTGIRHKKYDLICFWDVLEHMPDLGVAESLMAMSEYVAATIPIKPDSVKLKDWKHHKPDEHLHEFKVQGMIDWMSCLGFDLISLGQPECPPRQDIYSFLFKRGKHES